MKNKLQYKKLIAVSISLVMVFSLTACSTWENFKAEFIDGTTKNKTIKIGVLEPTTGTDSVDAAAEIQGIELAHTKYPSIGDMPVELVYADNGSDVEFCPTAAQSLIDAGCSVILGSYKSVLTLAASDTIKEAHIPAIAITNTNPLITSTNPYYFRVCYIDEFEGQVAAQFVYEQLQTTNVAVLFSDGSDYSSAMVNEFIAKSEEVSGEYQYINQVIYPADTTDFGEYFLQLYYLSPSAIFFPSTKEVAEEVIQSAVLQGYDFTWIGTSKWDGIAFDNVYYTLDYDPSEATTEVAKEFQAAYRQTYGNDKVASDAVALGYDAYLLALEGIKGAMEDEEISIVSALENVENLECATGYLTMSKSGDPIKEVIVEKYEDGQRAVVYTQLPTKDGREEEGETK